MKRPASLLPPLLAAAGPASALELTPGNFLEMTGGKTVFLKFFAPWCEVSQELKPDWDRLTEDFAESKTQLIADVDCDADGEDLCVEHGVVNVPALKWGDPSDLQDYDGELSYEDLKKFAEENLKPQCSVKNIDLCNGGKKFVIKTYQEMSLEDLGAVIDAKGEKIRAAEERFEAGADKVQEDFVQLKRDLGGKSEEFAAENEKLQDRYEQLENEWDAEVAATKAELGLARSVMKGKGGGGKRRERTLVRPPERQARLPIPTLRDEM